jgi:hypothetical protein
MIGYVESKKNNGEEGNHGNGIYAGKTSKQWGDRRIKDADESSSIATAKYNNALTSKIHIDH